MALLNITSPHLHQRRTTGQVMREVIYAALPGLIVLCIVFDLRIALNVLLACGTAVLAEAAVLAARQQPLGLYLKDGSALVTGLLLGLAVPAGCPPWVIIVGSLFAIVVVKQLYGGLGMNPFNPAMAAYVLLLVSVPAHMTQWPLPLGIAADAITGATPLDTFKTYAGQPEVLTTHPILQGLVGGYGWEWVNVAFLLGGLWLLYRRIITWHIPLSMLAAMSLMALIFGVAGDIDNYAGIGLTLFSGGTMLGAFFIATDPVSAATSLRGKLIFGAGIGVLTYVIRSWGGYPDAIAFSVLLMNLSAPLLDYYTQPRAYGHRKASSGLAGRDQGGKR